MCQIGKTEQRTSRFTYQWNDIIGPIITIGVME